MTNEELDCARVEEAWRQYNIGNTFDTVVLIAARLAREGWTPPAPVDPDLIEARRMAGSIYSGSRFERDCIAGKRDTSPDVVTMLAGIKLGRALAAEAKPGMVWVKHDGSRKCPVPEYAWVWSKPFTSTPDPACHLNWQHVTHYAVITPPEDVA